MISTRRGSPIALRTIGPVPSKRYQEAVKEGGDPFAGDGCKGSPGKTAPRRERQYRGENGVKTASLPFTIFRPGRAREILSSRKKFPVVNEPPCFPHGRGDSLNYNPGIMEV
jgi:hypothetical protein